MEKWIRGRMNAWGMLLVTLVGVDTGAAQGVPQFEYDDQGKVVSIWYSGPSKAILEAQKPNFDWSTHRATVKDVQLSHMRINSDVLKTVAGFSELEWLQIGAGAGPMETNVEVGAYTELAKLKKLKFLELVEYVDEGSKDRSDFTWISQLEALESLSLLGSLTRDDLSALLSLEHLEELDVWELQEATDDQLRNLGKRPMRKLQISMPLPSLDPLFSELRTDDRMESLEVHSKQPFRLSQMRIVNQLAGLNFLSISEVDGRQLSLLTELAQLEVFSVGLRRDSKVANLDFVNNMPKLQNLFVRQTRNAVDIVYDCNLTSLADHPTLTYIDLPLNSRIGPADVDALRKVPSLRYLKVGHSRLSVYQLRRRLPNVKVEIVGKGGTDLR